MFARSVQAVKRCRLCAVQPNARAGLKVPLAQVDAELPGNFKIKRAKLRGVESQGMLCAEQELGLSDSADGLMELASDAPVGTDLRHYLDLDDQVIDISVTPNRADCLGIAGIAREVGLLNNLAVTEPAFHQSSRDDSGHPFYRGAGGGMLPTLCWPGDQGYRHIPPQPSVVAGKVAPLWCSLHRCSRGCDQLSTAGARSAYACV